MVIKFKRSADSTILKITQEKYTERLLELFGMLHSRPVDTPMAAIFLIISGNGTKDYEEQNEVMKHPFGEVMGSLLYLAQRSRPNISFAVSLLCRYVQDPGMHHWNAAKHIMRYLRGTATNGLIIGNSTSHATSMLEAFVDSDWAG